MAAYVYNRTSLNNHDGNGYTDLVALKIKIPSTVNVYHDTTDVITLVRTCDTMDAAWDFMTNIMQEKTFETKEWYSIRFKDIVCEGMDF